MAKRKLTRQQRQRIHAQQEQSRQSSEIIDDTAQQTGLVIQHHGKQAIVEDTNARLIHCKIRQNLGSIVCGDQVVWEEKENDEGIIVAVKGRRNVLARPDFRRQVKPFVANIDQIIIVTATEPELSLHLLDRYLIITETVSLDAIIVINKTDLMSQNKRQQIEQTLSTYEQLGYPVIYTSAKVDDDLNQLQTKLGDQASIMVGQSGVGKSSLINRLLPDLDIKVGKLTQANHGKHTTSTSILYHLPTGGDIIDSPGIRDFGLWDISEAQITNGFIEFRPYIGQCRFHNCRHLNEPDCAVKQAAKKGEISPLRLSSYQQMLAELATEN